MTTPRLLSCDEALCQLYAYLDHELDSHAHEAIEHHLRACPACFFRAEFERRLKERLHETWDAKVSADLQARIRKVMGC